MGATTDVYRDATFTKTTRDRLEKFAAWVEGENVDGCDVGLAAAAARDVVRRWDENEATEFEAEVQ